MPQFAMIPLATASLATTVFAMKQFAIDRFADGVSSGLLFAQEAAPAKPFDMASLLRNAFPFLMIAVLFYFLMIRPERRKKADLVNMLQNLKRNDRVVTIGGIYGAVVSISKNAEEVTLVVDDSSNTKLKVQRSAIARVLNAETDSLNNG